MFDFFSLLLLFLTFQISIVGIFQVLHEKRRLHYKFCFLLLSKYFGGLSFGVSLWIKKSAFLLPVSRTGKLDTVNNILCISADDNNNNDNFYYYYIILIVVTTKKSFLKKI